MLKIIVNRIKRKYMEEIGIEQAGFVEGRGTREQIVNIRLIIEKHREHNLPLHMCFVDYAKAFDCVSHQQLWIIMRNMGFPGHIVELLASLCEDQEATVRTSCGDMVQDRPRSASRVHCITNSVHLCGRHHEDSYQ